MRKGVLIATALGWLAVAAVAAPPATDDWIAGLEGGWYGENNMTPMGRMPFVMLFDRQEDGSLFSHSALNRETFIDLRFRRAENGRWLLEEAAGMEGLGMHAYTLEPVPAPGELRRWELTGRPGFLTVDMSVDGDRLFMLVKLRGRDHVQYELNRLPDEELPALREELAAASRRAPAEDSIHHHVSDESVPAPILEARRAVAEDPGDAAAQLRLGQVIGAVLQEDPGQGALYAGEMLRALRSAVELDPSVPEAYHWLAGYYLNAPPIAGGSAAKAEEVARRLAAIDPQSAEELLAEIEQVKRGVASIH